MIDFKSMGVRIKKLRKAQNMTQEVLAEKLNISVEHISRIENGSYRPSLSLIEKISEIFEVSESLIMFGSSSNNENMELIEKLNLLTEEKKHAVLEIITQLLK